jgi:hypothetical protein
LNQTVFATTSPARPIPFIQNAAGLKPAVQVTNCDWNVQHPRWFPPGSTGDKIMLIAAAAKNDESQFHIPSST